MNFIKHWFEIFCFAWKCIWQRLNGEEETCPKCWKCTLARWTMFFVAAALGYATVYAFVWWMA